MKNLIISAAALVAALTLLAAETNAKEPNKFQGALTIEQVCAQGFVFMQAGPSGDEKTIRWTFKSVKDWDDLPIVIDVGANPSMAEVRIASVAALTEARFIRALLHAATPKESPKQDSGPKLYF
jgi:hypothetical protein